jgi:hypothetical protein
MTVTLHFEGGRSVTTPITDEVARDLLREQWRYAFHEQNLNDREKVARMVSTQVALAFEKGTRGEGIFVLDDTIGRKWLIPNRRLVAMTLDDGLPESTSSGFGQFEPDQSRDGVAED